ncbi:MAG: GNAT family N-acetyltransferase [Parachlamydiales bacterium]|nr:GNAT family N-acetyltransferase [Parachlamydiales bacterium]
MLQQIPPIAFIQVESPDLFHQVGQVLVRPVSYIFGRSFTVHRDGVRELPPTPLMLRIAAVALAILCFPIVLGGLIVGMFALACSRTYMKAHIQVDESNISITWNGNRPEIETRQLKLRPIQAEDLPAYQALFNNPVAMQNYRGGVRDITARFQIWLNRWQEHSFSALAVVDGDRVIGHTIIGHGDFEAADHGSSELAVVIDPAYWNARHEDGPRGSAHRYKIGTEVVRAMVAYAKALKERGALVPVDVEAGQNVDGLNVHRNAQGAVDWAYVPFTELKATVHRHNIAAQMVGSALAGEYGATRRIQDMERDLYTLQLA